MIKTPALAIELDALGDTRALWLAWLESARGVLDVDPDELPVDRADAAAALDDAGAGNWRILLERFSEDHAPAFLRRDAATSARLQALVDGGATLGVFTDAPDELARTALAQLGASRRISALETGAGAFLERLDRIADELARLNRTTERQEGFTLVARELHDLQESLNALAYAALGQAPPRVRRRAS